MAAVGFNWYEQKDQTKDEDLNEASGQVGID